MKNYSLVSDKFFFNKGFTLLEVVIAMALGTLGILAFAALQLKSLEATTQSHERSTAVFLASEMMERMSSNAQDYGAQLRYLGEEGEFWNQTINEYDDNLFATADTEYCYGLTSNCTEVDMAAADILVMRQMAKALLPDGDMIVHKCGNDFYQCIVVAWLGADRYSCEKKDGLSPDDCFVLQIKIW
jgi:type IV pilus assembly protein PilV